MPYLSQPSSRPAPAVVVGLLACLASSLLGASRAAAAGPVPGEWTSLGPPGATAGAFARAAAPSDAVYVGVRDAGVFRSDDDGRSWTAARDGLFAREVHVLAGDPHSPATLLAGTERGVFRTEDGGASWTLHTDGLPSDPPLPVRALAIDPNAPRVVWAGAGAGVFRSEDGGRTWSDAGEDPGGSVVLALAVHPSEVLLAGTNRGVFRSEDAGQTWTRAGESADPELQLGNVVNELVVDPSGPGTAYIALIGPGPSLARSDDGGATWVPIIEGLPHNGESPGGGWALALDPTRPDTLFAGGDEGIFRLAGDGGGWTLVSGGTDAFGPGVLVPAALVTRSGAVLAGTADLFTDELGTGVVRSPDGLSDWRTVTSGLTAIAVAEVVPDPHVPGLLYALRADGRLLRSASAGETWTPADLELPMRVVDVAADPVRPGVLYAVVAGTPSGPEPFFRSEDRGRSWARAGAGLPPSVERIEVLPPAAQGGVPVLLAWPVDATVYRSTDGGATFQVAGRLPVGGAAQVSPRGVEAHPPGTLYVWGAARLDPSNCPGSPIACELGNVLFRSTDGGETWTELEIPGGTGALGPLAVAPEDPATVYFLVGGTLFRSGERGESWTEIAAPPSTEIPAAWEDLPDEPDLLADPRQPGVLYLSTPRDGLLRSADGGRTWARRNAGLASPSLGTLALRSAPAGATLFAASSGGAWALPLGNPPPPPPAGPSFITAEPPGFRVWARITAGDGSTPAVRREPSCIPETLCVSGAVPGRSEIFVRIVGPKPNGFLWPTIVKFSTSQVEVWIEQQATGEVNYYRLEGARPGVDELPGLFDRKGFEP